MNVGVREGMTAKGARNKSMIQVVIMLRHLVSIKLCVCVYPFNKKITESSIESNQKFISPVLGNTTLVEK